MPDISRRNLLAGGGASASLGLVGFYSDGYTKARISSIFSPLPGIRATGEPLTVRKKVTSKDVEYLPESNEVRIVIARNSKGSVEYATRPFEKWAEVECGSVATDEVQRYISITFGNAASDIMSGSSFENGQSFVTTAPTERAVTRKEMVLELPDHVTVTVELTGKEYTTRIPVAVKERQEVTDL